MRLVIQRVLEAGVKVDGEFISKIGPGICILLGLHRGDTPDLVDKWADKALKLKLWPELEEQTEEQKQSNSPKGKGGWKTNVIENNFSVLVVSNFTLYGILKGNKPDFHSSMAAEEAKALYERFLVKMQEKHSAEKVQGGMFQTYMNVHIVGDGPVTLCLDEDVVQQEEKQLNTKQVESEKEQKKPIAKNPNNDNPDVQKQKKPQEISEEQRQKQKEKQQSKKQAKLNQGANKLPKEQSQQEQNAPNAEVSPLDSNKLEEK